jgi:hypothetical protein
MMCVFNSYSFFFSCFLLFPCLPPLHSSTLYMRLARISISINLKLKFNVEFCLILFCIRKFSSNLQHLKFDFICSFFHKFTNNSFFCCTSKTLKKYAEKRRNFFLRTCDIFVDFCKIQNVLNKRSKKFEFYK